MECLSCPLPRVLVEVPGVDWVQVTVLVLLLVRSLLLLMVSLDQSRYDKASC